MQIIVDKRDLQMTPISPVEAVESCKSKLDKKTNTSEVGGYFDKKHATKNLAEQLLEKTEDAQRTSKVLFKINEKTNKVVAKVVDTETNEVIREVPSEQIIEMIADMCEKAGIFIDKRL